MLYDRLPVEIRREYWGWFGEPWPSRVCFDDDGKLRSELQKPFPDGQSCPHCLEVFLPGDSGQAMPYPDGIRHVHKECLLRDVLGPLAHLEKRCPHYGGTSNETPGMTRRQEAQAVWDYWLSRGSLPA